MNILALIPAYREYLKHERNLAESSVTSYISDLNVMSRTLSDDVSTITLDDMRKYQRNLSKSGLKTTTVARKFHGFSTFWKWLRMEKHVEENIIERIRLPQRQKPIPRWLSEDDLRKFVDSPVSDPDPFIQMRNALAWKTLAWLGVRRSELLKLKVVDVHFRENLITIRRAKGNQDRALILPAQLKEAFRELIGDREADAYVFSRPDGRKWSSHAFTRAFHNHVENCDLSQPNITPHILRHTFATHLTMKDVRIEVVQELLGHQDIKNTLIYTHVSTGRKRRAMSRHVLNKKEKE